MLLFALFFLCVTSLFFSLFLHWCMWKCGKFFFQFYFFRCCSFCWCSHHEQYIWGFRVNEILISCSQITILIGTSISQYTYIQMDGKRRKIDLVAKPKIKYGKSFCSESWNVNEIPKYVESILRNHYHFSLSFFKVERFLKVMSRILINLQVQSALVWIMKIWKGTKIRSRTKG